MVGTTTGSHARLCLLRRIFAFAAYQANAVHRKVWHNPVHERDESKEAPSLRTCFSWLDKTSRSFSAVIKELHPELLVPVCLFYLVLRGLDTIEDDMTIPLETKEPLLRDFDKKLEQDGWTFDGNGEKEKDRGLLVEFNCVIEEFKKIKLEYRVIIKDITKKMGDGMADYCNNAEHNKNGVNTIKDYELYCHYVAGLVGEGLTRLFVEGKLANPALLKRPDLHESMGQFLQQVNIIRDIREDLDDGRRFWPKEIWSKHVDNFEDLFKPENKEKALNCSSEMILQALNRAPDCLFYLAGIRDQSVFNFCAIPQSMAIATLDLCFRNYSMFERNIKITKGQACHLMMESTQNLELVCNVFKDYARKIHRKNDPRDPNFLQISIACGKVNSTKTIALVAHVVLMFPQIEQFIESIFPSSKPTDGKYGQKGRSPEEIAKMKAEEAQQRKEVIYMALAVLLVLFVISMSMVRSPTGNSAFVANSIGQVLVAWLAGARFDLLFQNLSQGSDLPQSSKAVEHGEL
jgi:farnesyl-diphosphate farnesyltransferase